MAPEVLLGECATPASDIFRSALLPYGWEAGVATGLQPASPVCTHPPRTTCPLPLLPALLCSFGVLLHEVGGCFHCSTGSALQLAFACWPPAESGLGGRPPSLSSLPAGHHRRAPAARQPAHAKSATGVPPGKQLPARQSSCAVVWSTAGTAVPTVLSAGWKRQPAHSHCSVLIARGAAPCRKHAI